MITNTTNTKKSHSFHNKKENIRHYYTLMRKKYVTSPERGESIIKDIMLSIKTNLKKNMRKPRNLSTINML